MYKSFYNLTRKPFETIPDTSFLWLGEKHQEALSTLHYGILDNKGFLLLTGEKGTGKTTLISGLTKSFNKDVEWAVISNPSLERIDFYNEIARNFGMDKQFTSKVQFLIQFSHFLHKADDENKKVLLLIDECHLLSQEMLEELRLLSNIEKADAKLINIFFVGEPGFNELLTQPKNRAVRQRLALTYNLKALTSQETEDYIRHRLSSGGSDEKIFSAKAVQSVHSFSGGIPLKINRICDAALKIGAERGEAVITPAIVETASGKMDTYSVVTAAPIFTEAPVSEKLAQPRMAPVENSHHYRFGDDPDSKLTGFNLEGDRRGGWLKLGLAALALVVVAGYFLRPQDSTVTPVQPTTPAVVQKDEAPLPAKLPGSTSPAVSVLEDNKNDINLNKAKELKTAILEKAYEEVDKTKEVAEPVVPENVAEAVSEPVVPEDVAEAVSEPVVPEKVSDAVSEPVQPVVEEVVEAVEVVEGKVAVAPTVVSEEETVPEVQATIAAETEPIEEPQVEIVFKQVGVQQSPEAAQETPVSQQQEVVLEQPVVKDDGVQLISEARQKVVNEVDPAMMPLEPTKVILPLLPNSLDLTSRGRKKLVGFVEKLKNYPKATILVKGFVSSKNNSPENIKLSEDRAESVYKKLLSEGVDPEQIEMKGMGNKEPIASNDTRAGRSKNRRVEIVVISDGI